MVTVRLTSALAAKVLQVAHLEGVLVEMNAALTAEQHALLVTAAKAAHEKEMALAFEAQSSNTEEAFSKLLQVCCSVLQCVALCLRRSRVRPKRLFCCRCVAMCCSVLQCV